MKTDAIHRTPVKGFLLGRILGEAIQTIVRRPGRACLAMAGMVVGVAAVITVAGLQTSASLTVANRFASLGVDEIVLRDLDEAGDGFTPEAVARLEATNAVATAGSVASLGAAQVLVVGGEARTHEVEVLAVSAHLGDAIGVEIDDGRWFLPAETALGLPVVVIGRLAAGQLGLNGPGAQLTISGRTYGVVGVAATTMRGAATLQSIWMPDTTALERVGSAAARTVYVVAVPGGLSQATQEAPIALSPSSPETVGAEFAARAATTQSLVISDLDQLSLVLSVVVLVVGAVGIAGMSFVSVLERTREIGVRRAVGALGHHVAGQIIAEAALLGVLGGVVGLAAGIAATSVLASVRGWDPAVPLSVALFAPVVGAVLGALAGVLPATRAVRITPIEALRQP